MIWRLIKTAVLLVVVVLFAAAVWAVAAVRTDRPVEYADITEQFKYGSIGSEPGGSLLATVGGVLPPYAVFKALPEICSDKLPGGLASVGMIVEPGHDLPIGVSRRRRLGIDQVGFNCALCHSGTVRDTPTAAPRVVLGMPAHQLDLESLVRFVLDCSLDNRTTGANVLGRARELPGGGPALFERLLLRLGLVDRLKVQVLNLRNRIDGGKASIDPLNKTTGTAILTLLLERGANPNVQLFFKPANAPGALNTRGVTPLIRAATNGDLEAVKLLLAHGADATVYTADRQTPIHAVLAGRAPEAQAVELIKVLQEAGSDVNVVALINHPEEIRGGTALHYAVRKRLKEVIKLLASLGIDMNVTDQDGLTALDYTQSRGFMPFMALQTPVYKDEAALLRELGATRLMAKNPVWPVLGPPQGIWEDIYPLGESQVHAPVYKHD